MSSLANAVSFDANAMWVDFTDGRKSRVPRAYFLRLLNATPTQREHYEISGGGSGLHWDAINEDSSVECLLIGIGDRTQRPFYGSLQYIRLTIFRAVVR